MIKIGQFSTLENSAVFFAARLAIHLRNQKTESLLSLQKRFCTPVEPGKRVVFIESLIILYSLGKISFDDEFDRVKFNENN